MLFVKTFTETTLSDSVPEKDTDEKSPRKAVKKHKSEADQSSLVDNEEGAFFESGVKVTTVAVVSFDPYRLPPDPTPRYREAPQPLQQNQQPILTEAFKNKPTLEVLERADELRAREEEAQRQIRRAEVERVMSNVLSAV